MRAMRVLRRTIPSLHTVSHDTYMMLEAMTALLSLPRVTSHRLSRSRMTVTRKLQGQGASCEPHHATKKIIDAAAQGGVHAERLESTQCQSMQGTLALERTGFPGPPPCCR